MTLPVHLLTTDTRALLEPKPPQPLNPGTNDRRSVRLNQYFHHGLREITSSPGKRPQGLPSGNPGVNFDGSPLFWRRRPDHQLPQPSNQTPSQGLEVVHTRRSHSGGL
jgi:hypothetical protein